MGRPLSGQIRSPGDKSISHRALILAALAEGRSLLRGLNEGDDCRSTRRALNRLGATFEDTPDGVIVTGAGGALHESDEPLDAGNSGTTLRLLMGVAAATPGLHLFTGDGSLRARPMDRVADPLRNMGAELWLRQGRFAPLAVRGRVLVPIRYVLPVPSAQVKSALLLAGLVTAGTTEVVEPIPTRDHTERALMAFGGVVTTGDGFVRITGPQRLRGAEVIIPGDLSAALFLLVAGALVPGSRVTALEVGINPTRRAGLDLLARMGARVEIVERTGGGNATGEPIADVTVSFSELRGIEIGGAEAAQAIDELPILAVAAACARGVTRIRDAAELRVKESDRIAGIARGLATLGVRVDECPDGLDITGGGPGFRFAAGSVVTRNDHRLAMSFMVAGLVAQGPVVPDDMASAAISDPRFQATLDRLGQGGAGG